MGFNFQGSPRPLPATSFASACKSWGLSDLRLVYHVQHQLSSLFVKFFFFPSTFIYIYRIWPMLKPCSRWGARRCGLHLRMCRLRRFCRSMQFMRSSSCTMFGLVFWHCRIVQTFDLKFGEIDESNSRSIFQRADAWFMQSACPIFQRYVDYCQPIFQACVDYCWAVL